MPWMTTSAEVMRGMSFIRFSQDCHRQHKPPRPPVMPPSGAILNHPKLRSRRASVSDLQLLQVDLRDEFGIASMEMRRWMLIEVELNFNPVERSNRGHTPMYHKSSTSRAGSSRHSLTRTRNVTASRPSTMRWS